MTFKKTTYALTFCVLALALPATASAASRASVTTGGSRNVSYATAVVQGSINPHGSDTSYYIQYGPTHLYGFQSAIGGAGAGIKTVTVSVPLTGLEALTEYHYRLVAVNKGGVAMGADRTFKTTRVPLALAIVAGPSPVPYGGVALVQGTLSGTGNANRAIVLQSDPFPYTGGFHNITNPALTLGSGAFSFPVIGLTATTKYRVVTTPNESVASPEVVIGVTALVTRRATRLGHGKVRFSGVITPAVTGARVGILRIVKGKGKLAGAATLKPRNATSSSYSATLKAKPGVYRVLVEIVNGALASSYSTPFYVR